MTGVRTVPGDVYVQIEFADPRRPTARMSYSGIEIRGGKIRVPFSTERSAEIARDTMIVTVVSEHPVVVGQIVSDPPAIVGANDKGDDHDSHQQL
jgi:hypothetical protein